jgi:hypothetical protein
MLIIRKEQEKAFAKIAVMRFEENMVIHLNQFFPEECEALGREGTGEAIHHALERAGHYGIVSERDICLYMDVMFAFGRDFDEHPDLPWAKEILNDEALSRPLERIDKLVDVAMEKTEQARGIKPVR